MTDNIIKIFLTRRKFKDLKAIFLIIFTLKIPVLLMSNAYKICINKYDSDEA